MRAVGFVTAAPAVACRLSDLTASLRSVLSQCHGVVFALPDRSTSPVGPMVVLARRLSSLAAAGVLLAGQQDVSGPNLEGEAWKMKP